MWVKKQQLEPDMEKWIGSKLEKEYVKAVHCHPAYLTYIQSTSILSPCLFNLYTEYIMQNAGLDEVQARIKIAGRNINNVRYADDTTLMAESEEELKSLLMTVKAVNTKGQFFRASFGKNPRFQIQLDKRPLSPGTSREAGGAPCLNPRRGLTLLSPVCRDPAIGV